MIRANRENAMMDGSGVILNATRSSRVKDPAVGDVDEGGNNHGGNDDHDDDDDDDDDEMRILRRSSSPSPPSSPLIDPDEEIDEDCAFNSEDELTYGALFPPASSSSSNNNYDDVASNSNDDDVDVDNARAVDASTRSGARGGVGGGGGHHHRQQPRHSTTSSSTRARSSSIAIIDEMVAHHLQQQGGVNGGGVGGGGRNRIFSIDFDPAILDFGENDEIVMEGGIPGTSAAPREDVDDGVIVANATSNANVATSSVPDPLLLASSGRSGARTRSMSVSFRDDAGLMGSRASSASVAPSSTMTIAIVPPQQPQMNANMTNATMMMGGGGGGRDRGFSFECFSLGIDGDEPLFAGGGVGTDDVIDDDDDVDVHRHRLRPRGDSIIFDPTSFLMGGIHETSALLSSRYESASSLASRGGRGGDDDVVDVNGPSSSSSHLVPTTADYRPPFLHLDNRNPPTLESSEYDAAHLSHAPAMRRGDGGGARHPESTGRTTTTTRPHRQGGVEYEDDRRLDEEDYDEDARSSFLDDRDATHMTYGSDAAAAAVAAGMFHQISSSSSFQAPDDGVDDEYDGAEGSSSSSSSHAACPMELLNRGGRIGIYLPEERRARIAKFHSKRKIRIWRKRIKYDCRKKLADSRPRIKGRFVKRSDVDGDGFL